MHVLIHENLMDKNLSSSHLVWNYNVLYDDKYHTNCKLGFDRNRFHIPIHENLRNYVQWIEIKMLHLWIQHQCIYILLFLGQIFHILIKKNIMLRHYSQFLDSIWWFKSNKRLGRRTKRESKSDVEMKDCFKSLCWR